jgi:aminopeptidase N
MRTESGSTIVRQDYQPFPFQIPEVRLDFDLDAQITWVRSTLTVQRRKDVAHTPDLILDGEDLTLISVHLNGMALTEVDYQLSGFSLIIHNMPDVATLEVVSTCLPSKNTSLMGLYVSGQNLFTQCEAEGFRKICWFADRPDVMSIYHVTLRGDRKTFPLLLSNGNLIEQREIEDGRHEAKWHDPFAKPCYLFALVAGNFACREHYSETQSGRRVLLQVYSDPGSESQTAWAMESLERSLKWDEIRFGLELDLDRFMIVAARDFNMGAMENKGLNVFNAAYVLADPNTATDANYDAIEAVIGHEYFHNWTGNRVTCRDWFQLSLKEGLTVFRDQEFSADMMATGLSKSAAASARAVKRIHDVVGLRAVQFPEDSGPMAHPIRPESYQEIGNFYTATVYEKGAEVIRMLHTLLGEAGFRAGMDEYFRRHDGQAVTCDDFVSAMQWAYQQSQPEKNLEVFKRWYHQAGTPRVHVGLTYDATTQSCRVTLTQRCAPVGVEKQSGLVKQPFHIPVLFGLLDTSGNSIALHTAQGELPARSGTDTVLLELLTETQTWEFINIPSTPIPSILRDFSAPVIIEFDYRDQDLAILSAHDTNAFTRWEAGQELATRQILKMARAWRQTGTVCAVDPTMIEAWSAMLQSEATDSGLLAQTLSIPSEKTIAERMSPVDPLAIYEARKALRQSLGQANTQTLLATYQAQQTPGAYSPTPGPVGRRALKNLALSYLMAAEHPEAEALANNQFRHATNMTDRLAALNILAHESRSVIASEAVIQFYEAWQHEALVIDKWFAVQATSPLTDVEHMHGLMAHPAFTLRNPNRARAAIFAFCLQNPHGFHAPDGSGYAFWADVVIALDAINPEVAARLARTMDHWSRMIEPVRSLMQTQLKRVASHCGLSRNTLEIVSKALSL